MNNEEVKYNVKHLDNQHKLGSLNEQMLYLLGSVRQAHKDNNAHHKYSQQIKREMDWADLLDSETTKIMKIPYFLSEPNLKAIVNPDTIILTVDENNLPITCYKDPYNYNIVQRKCKLTKEYRDGIKNVGLDCYLDRQNAAEVKEKLLIVDSPKKIVDLDALAYLMSWFIEKCPRNSDKHSNEDIQKIIAAVSNSLQDNDVLAGYNMSNLPAEVNNLFTMLQNEIEIVQGKIENVENNIQKIKKNYDLYTQHRLLIKDKRNEMATLLQQNQQLLMQMASLNNSLLNLKYFLLFDREKFLTSVVDNAKNFNVLQSPSLDIIPAMSLIGTIIEDGGDYANKLRHAFVVLTVILKEIENSDGQILTISSNNENPDYSLFKGIFDVDDHDPVFINALISSVDTQPSTGQNADDNVKKSQDQLMRLCNVTASIHDVNDNNNSSANGNFLYGHGGLLTKKRAMRLQGVNLEMGNIEKNRNKLNNISQMINNEMKNLQEALDVLSNENSVDLERIDKANKVVKSVGDKINQLKLFLQTYTKDVNDLSLLSNQKQRDAQIKEIKNTANNIINSANNLCKIVESAVELKQKINDKWKFFKQSNEEITKKITNLKKNKKQCVDKLKKQRQAIIKQKEQIEASYDEACNKNILSRILNSGDLSLAKQKDIFNYEEKLKELDDEQFTLVGSKVKNLLVKKLNGIKEQLENFDETHKGLLADLEQYKKALDSTATFFWSVDKKEQLKKDLQDTKKSINDLIVDWNKVQDEYNECHNDILLFGLVYDSCRATRNYKEMSKEKICQAETEQLNKIDKAIKVQSDPIDNEIKSEEKNQELQEISFKHQQFRDKKRLEYYKNSFNTQYNLWQQQPHPDGDNESNYYHAAGDLLNDEEFIDMKPRANIN